MTHWKTIAENTGKVNSLGHYVPAGMNECAVCHTWDDPRQVSICINKLGTVCLCLTCALPYVEPLALALYPEEEVRDPNGAVLSYPKDPWKVSGTGTPVRPFEAMREKIEAAKQEDEASEKSV